MLFTVGHSTLSETDFIKMLDGRVDTIVDVRSHPGSKWPQFCHERLTDWLPANGVKYEWWPKLGGWGGQHVHLANEFTSRGVDIPAYAKGKFPKQRIGKSHFPDPSARPEQELLPGIARPFWNNQGLWDYEWFMTLEEFRAGAELLVQRGRKENLGFMCCEVLWWKCHRSMIADYLAFRGVECFHLQPKYTPHSKALGNRLDRYEPDVKAQWESWR